jgi:hydroxypyruvate isomerase
MLSRREFLAASATWTLGGIAAIRNESTRHAPFRRKFAPHLGMFRHHGGGDPLDQIRFIADAGFHALEDGGFLAKPRRLQSRIGDELARRGLSLGAFTAIADFSRPTFAAAGRDLRQSILCDLKQAIAVAKSVNGQSLTVVPGKRVSNVPWPVQMGRAADTLRFCADVCEREGIVLLLEPIDHCAGSPRLFLQSAAEAIRLCRAVGRSSCRVLLDVYQQTVSGQDLSRLIRESSDVIGYIQLADCPGRKEPGTGAIDFPSMFAAIDRIGYEGILGMEHGNQSPGSQGERLVIESYARVDRLV